MKSKVFLVYISVFFVITMVVVSLKGCGGLPSDIKKSCKKTLKTIEMTRGVINENQKAYTNEIKKDKYVKVKPAFTDENLAGIFIQALSDIERAEALYNANIKPLLKENKAELAAEVQSELKKTNTIITEAAKKSRIPVKRAKHIYDVFLRADDVFKKSKSSTSGIAKTVKEVEKTILPESKNSFPEKSKKIDTKFAPMVLMARESADALKKLTDEYNNHKKNNKTDYSALVKSADLIDDNSNEIVVLKKQFSNEIAGLSKSYTKILKDMTAVYTVRVNRESWNNSSDYSTPRIKVFVRTVSSEIYDFAENNQIETIAEIYPTWNKLKIRNNIGDIWTKLKINPVEDWPSQDGHDSAVFWFEGWRVGYLHQYTIIEDGKKYDTEFQPVSEDVYEDNFEYLGMAIVTKPYGMFEDETDTQATPPGMGFVGNPEYGRWEKDSSGNSFWSWYGKYALFSNLLFYSTMGPMRYSTWNNYNTNFRGRKPFFGQTKQGEQQYGTGGAYTRNHTGYRTSAFARSGGFKRQAPSVRGASEAVRGGGPKSRGK